MGLEFHEHGVPTIDAKACTNCGLCADVCGTETLVKRDGRIEVTAGSFMGCIGCGQCMSVCPTGAVRVTGRRLDPGDLATLPATDQRASADQFDALLLSRRSIRKFADRPVDAPVVKRILDMAATAPMGIPPSDVGVVVFHGRDKVHQFAADAVDCFRAARRAFSPLMLTLMRPFIGKATHRMLRDFVRPLLDAIVAEWDNGRDAFAYDAPLAVLFHNGPAGDTADTHIAATYAMLAGQSLGLGSCMLGTTQALNRAKAFRAKHGIPGDNKFGLAVVFGYPAIAFRRGIRRKLASVRYA